MVYELVGIPWIVHRYDSLIQKNCVFPQKTGYLALKIVVRLDSLA